MRTTYLEINEASSSFLNYGSACPATGDTQCALTALTQPAKLDDAVFHSESEFFQMTFFGLFKKLFFVIDEFCIIDYPPATLANEVMVMFLFAVTLRKLVP
jgi:hypothetical protein